MFIPAYAYQPPPPPPQTWDEGNGPPPTDRPTDAGPWLDSDTGILYIPQEP